MADSISFNSIAVPPLSVASVESSRASSPSPVQVTVQSASVPASRMRLALQSSSTAMKVATTSDRLRLPRNRARNRVTPKCTSRWISSAALSETG
jgi:hypothetical protein